MKKIEAIEELMTTSSGVGQDNIKKYDEPFDKLVSEGFAAVKERPFKRGFYEYVATAATPLALLTNAQFLCAQQLAGNIEIGFDAVPKAQKAHMAKLVDNGWATMDKHGSAWKATQKLIAAIECWRIAKGKRDE